VTSDVMPLGTSAQPETGQPREIWGGRRKDAEPAYL
jgi:hypothetical protein